MKATRNDRIAYLQLLEEKRRREAFNDLNAYCRYIDMPSAPVNDDEDCEQFYVDSVTPSAHHILLNDALMRVECGDIQRLLVMMPPGSAKSTYGTVAFPTWFIGRKRGRSVITTGYGDSLSQKFSRKSRQITKSEKYNEIFNTGLLKGNESAHSWELENGSALMAAGLLSGLTGNRTDGLIIDDPVKGREDADSPTTVSYTHLTLPTKRIV